jgi:hypothetical protein
MIKRILKKKKHPVVKKEEPFFVQQKPKPVPTFTPQGIFVAGIIIIVVCWLIYLIPPGV